ncbi:MAG: ribonuclease, partial [Acidimicrobiaceae bacterium]
MSEPVTTGPIDPQEPSTDRAEQPEAGDSTTPRPKRRRGSRGGRNRNRSRTSGSANATDEHQPDELPERPNEGRPKTVEAAERALVRKPDPNAPKPKIGDSRPAPAAKAEPEGAEGTPARRRRRRGGRGRTAGGGQGGGGQGGRGQGGGGERRPSSPVQAMLRDDSPLELDDDVLETRRGRERKGRPLGRYLMCVHVQDPESGSADGRVTQIAVLEGRSLLEHYVSRPADDVSQIHGNIYLGRVQNVLPG